MVLEVTIAYNLNGSQQGLSIIHFGDPTSSGDMTSQVHTFLLSAADLMPDMASVSWSGVYDHLNTGTGEFEGEFSFADPDEVTGTIVGGDIVPQNVSAQYNWLTGGVVAGHRVKGRSFVPFTDRSLNVGGELVASFSTPQFADRVVWSRPLKDGGAIVRPGSVHPVTSVTVNREYSTMGSRRRA